MSASDIIRQVKKLEIRTHGLVEGLISGSYHSIFKGQGIEFSEIREYYAGDDTRAIDWKVTARLDKPYVKEFIEERDLNVYFAFDMSASGSFGDHTSKRYRGTEIAASLMFSAMQNNDNVGLLMFTDTPERFIPARKGRKHILRLLSELVSYKPGEPGTDIGSSLAFLSKVLKKKSIIFILSDFCSRDFSKPLRILRNRHDVVCFIIYEDHERCIPDIGLVELEDEETGEQILVDTSDEDFQASYRKSVDEHRKNLHTMLKKSKVDAIEISARQTYYAPLKAFFARRKA